MKTFLFDELTPVALYGELKKIFTNEVTMLFESVVNTNDGNFSFIAIGAKERIIYKNETTIHIDETAKSHNLNISPFEFLKSYYAKIDKTEYIKRAERAGFSFTDGFIGFIGYDMVKVFEPVLKESMSNLKDTLNTPDLDLIRPKIIIGFSHKNSMLTIIDNEKTNDELMSKIENILKQSHTPTPLKRAILKEGKLGIDKNQFEQLIDESKEHIKSGDVFQILISNRYTQYGSVDRLSFYRLLRSKNPSPYLFLLEFEDFAICGSSPEVMIKLTNNDILLRPIAGTRKRGKDRQRDIELEAEMVNDPKECAEHLMLIDLGRNDVGRVARTGTVKVTDMMRVERYSHVMHMVSDIEAQLADDKDMFDLFMATFTAGTMTGAPKIKAMELIAKFEKLKRGYYSGSVGYFAFNGNMDSAIAIRTALIQDDKVTLQAGAGVVADSKPELEFLEVNNKLGALKATLEELQNIQ
ncbi:Anthranilate synthase component I [Sulfurovum sp. enrichment culture clone C5]|uniref:Anthranilate synthase component 1 n=2 Tax=root TaxID=1 RepID=A0A0S4XLW2_9BACT|nr:Anthranilate synthase component I [Sulfurovum sp. enrichment culture clone C5]